MSYPHFETATMGAKAAREIVARGAFVVGLRPCVVHSFVGTAHTEERLCAIFEDGVSVQIPAYAGATVERIHAIAALKWGDEQEAAYRRCTESGTWPDRPAPDATGARL